MVFNNVFKIYISLFYFKQKDLNSRFYTWFNIVVCIYNMHTYSVGRLLFMHIVNTYRPVLTILQLYVNLQLLGHTSIHILVYILLYVCAWCVFKLVLKYLSLKYSCVHTVDLITSPFYQNRRNYQLKLFRTLVQFSMELTLVCIRSKRNWSEIFIYSCI